MDQQQAIQEIRLSFLELLENKSPLESIESWFASIAEKELDLYSALLLMEEAFESLDIKTCKEMFPQMECLIETGSIDSKSVNIILRICNYLLKRLSRSFEKEIRFQIHKKLSQWIPDISDRSSVNLLGNFAEKCDCSAESLNPTFNQIRHLYEASKDPVTYFRAKISFSSFLEKLEKLLDTLAKINEYTRNIGIKRPREHLLDLLLTDSAFVSHLLSKVIVLYHTIEHPANSTQEEVFMFTEHQKNLMKNAANKSETLLHAVSSSTLGSIKLVLKSETTWAQWKHSSCPKFEKPPCKETTEDSHIEIEEGEVEEQRFMFQEILNYNKGS